MMNDPKGGMQMTRRLLHINHPAAILRLVERYCQSKKYSVDSVESLSLGLHYALVRRYRLIVLGLPTRGLDAPRFLKGLLSAKVTAPVLIMSEFQFKEQPELGKFPNVLGFISKPLDIHIFSKYLDATNGSPELDPQEKKRLISILECWESDKALAY